MLSSFLDVLLKLSKTTSYQAELYEYDKYSISRIWKYYGNDTWFEKVTLIGFLSKYHLILSDFSTFDFNFDLKTIFRWKLHRSTL